MSDLKYFSLFYKKVFITLGIILIVAISLVKTKKLSDNKKLINSNPAYTIGTITDYGETGDANYYLKYKYLVEGGIYTNEVSPNVLFKNCENDSSCFNKEILVKYYKTDPSISIAILDTIIKK